MAKKKVASKNKARTKRKGSVRPLAPEIIDANQEIATDIDQYLKLTGGSLSEAIKLITTTNKNDAITQAEKNYQEDDLIGAITDTKVDFYSAGFGIHVAPKTGTSNESLNRRIDRVMLKNQMQKVAEELVHDFVVTQNAILQWTVEKGSLKYVTTINPSRVKYSNSVGHDTLFVRLDNEIVEFINANMYEPEKLRELKKKFPAKYIKAVQDGTNTVKLSNEDGEYWVVRTDSRRFSGLAMPTMKKVFMDIILRRLLISGDWTLAYFVKRIIEIVKSGESITSGPLAGTSDLYMTNEQKDELKAVFKNKTSQALRMFANHTVTVDYHAPDPELFTVEKFEKVEQRILRWGAVIDTIMTGFGDSFAEGMIGVKRFVAYGKRVRQAVGDMFETFILHPSIAMSMKIPKGSRADISWDEQNLKDDKQVLDELVALMDRGALDVQTFLDRLGHNYEFIKARKAVDKKDRKLWVPTFEPRQGLLSALFGAGNGGKEGAPEGGGVEPGGRPLKGTRTEPRNKPRPSRRKG